jgi:hypothetical protein
MKTPMRSLARLTLGVSLFLAGASSFSGTAGGQFGVRINLSGVNNACTSSTNSGSGGASVQVSCNSDVFVNIGLVRGGSDLGNSRFMPGYRPTRDSLLPDYCRNELSRNDPGARMTCRLDDQRQASAGDDEEDDGWQFESRRYAMGPEAAAIETQARLRLQDARGTLTAVRLAHAGNQPRSIEMLVSF